MVLMKSEAKTGELETNGYCIRVRWRDPVQRVWKQGKRRSVERRRRIWRQDIAMVYELSRVDEMDRRAWE